MPLLHPAADFYFGFSGYDITRVLAVTGLTLFLFSIVKRLALLCMGKPDPRFSDIQKRLWALFTEGILQNRQLRYPAAGIIHILIFWGFVILSLHSINLVGTGSTPRFSLSFMDGWFCGFYNTIKDVFVILVSGACIFALYRRAVLKPSRYKDSSGFEAYLILCMILLLMITGSAYEAAGLIAGMPVAGFPAAALGMKIMMSGMSPESVKWVHQAGYWLHLACFFVFLNLLPLSKHFHILTALPNVFFKKFETGVLKPPQWNQYDLEKLDMAGVKVFSDFTWKHILDFLTCTECGRCTDNCPAYAVGRPLSPKSISVSLRDFAYQHDSFSKHAALSERSIPGEIVPDASIWACTTCGACEAECPAWIEYIDKIVELRRHRVLMESRFPLEIEPVFRNMEIYGDAWGMGTALRSDWAAGLNVKTIHDNPDVDLLFWVGCASAFDSRSRQIAASFVRILQKAGVSFVVLGPEENCCGDYARRTGNEFLFQMLAKKNIEILNKYNIKKIVTICPHGFHAMKNEYPQLGGHFEVMHASELVFGLLDDGKILFKGQNNKTIAYHDPCYLGRHNGLYDIPRQILSRLPDAVLVEPDKNKDRSVCCGAGGGHFWMESSGNRINDMRIAQILEKKPDVVATACPYCLIMLEDGVESKELKGRVLVKDILEIVEENLSKV